MKNKVKNESIIELFDTGYVKIKRHIKIKAEATPFDSEYKDYFTRLKLLRKRNFEQEYYGVERLPVF